MYTTIHTVSSSQWITATTGSLSLSEQHQAAVDPQTRTADLGCKSTYRLLSSTLTISVYYYSAPKLIYILPSHGGWKAKSIWAAHVQDCTLQWFLWQTHKLSTVGFDAGILAQQSGMLPLDHCDLQLVCVWVSRLTTTTNSVPKVAFVRVRTFTFVVWLVWIMLGGTF